MGTAADVARVVLALVFTVAAVAKLLDLPGSRRTMAAFGLGPGLAARAGTVLPFVELAVALALVLEATARWGGVAALGLLLVFIAGIANSLARGRTPDCNCFGQLGAKPVSWRTLARNAALAALAGLVAVEGTQSSLLGWTGDDDALATIGMLAALGLVAAAVVAQRMWRDARSLREELAHLRRRTELLPAGLPVGLRAPDFELPDVRGETIKLSSLCARGRPVALLFLSSGCGPCTRLLPDLARWHRALEERVTFAVVANGGPDREEIAEELRGAGDFIAVIQEDQEVADSFWVTSTPAAILIDPDGRIGTALAGGVDEIEALVRLALERTYDFEVPRGDLVEQPA